MTLSSVVIPPTPFWCGKIGNSLSRVITIEVPMVPSGRKPEAPAKMLDAVGVTITSRAPSREESFSICAAVHKQRDAAAGEIAGPLGKVVASIALGVASVRRFPTDGENADVGTVDGAIIQKLTLLATHPHGSHPPSPFRRGCWLKGCRKVLHKWCTCVAQQPAGSLLLPVA